MDSPYADNAMLFGLRENSAVCGIQRQSQSLLLVSSHLISHGSSKRNNNLSSFVKVQSIGFYTPGLLLLLLLLLLFLLLPGYAEDEHIKPHVMLTMIIKPYNI